MTVGPSSTSPADDEAGMSESGYDEVLAPEDLARANLYGLISRLFYAPVDPQLLAEISRSAESNDAAGGDLVAAWGRLRDACRSAFPAVARQEYDSLFVGVGRSEVSPYLSGYAEPSGPDRYLVRLREQLSAWRLGRRQSVPEVEDHVSGLCDVMRWLIVEGRDVAEQKQFFDGFFFPGVVPFCAAVQNSSTANFYKPVAAFAAAFFDLEKSAFEMSEAV